MRPSHKLQDRFDMPPGLSFFRVTLLLIADEKRRELNVVYEANLNGERKRACEIMQFDASGRQIRGEALYGAII